MKTISMVEQENASSMCKKNFHEENLKRTPSSPRLKTRTSDINQSQFKVDCPINVCNEEGQCTYTIKVCKLGQQVKCKNREAFKVSCQV